MPPSESSPVSRIVAALRTQIQQGKPGQRLPSVRILTQTHRASAVTVSRALAQLQEEGLLSAQVGAGTFISEQAPQRRGRDLDWQRVALGRGQLASDLVGLVTEAPAGALPLSSGYMDPSLQPTRELARVMGRVLRREDAWDRAPVAGLPELRSWFARRAGGGAELQDVLLLSGGQAAIRTAFFATTQPGQRVLLDAPSYLGATAAARSLGLQPVGVPCDAEGLRPDLLEEAFERSGAKVLYCQPAFANPTGVTMSASRRADVLALARKHFAFVIEDDYAADLSYSGRTPPTLFSQDDGHVIYVRSLTKSVAPSMRLAAVCARGPVMARLRACRVLDDFFVARPLQSAALELVGTRAFAGHLARLQGALAERMRRVRALVPERLPGVTMPYPSTGGYSLWLRLPDGQDDDALALRAAQAGVLVSPGRRWFPAEPVPGYLRLSVAGAPTEVLEAGLARLGHVMERSR